jgi:hypothetical protein
MMNVQDIYQVAQQYAAQHQVPLDSVVVDEVLRSRRFKHFKFLCSQVEQEPVATAKKMEHVYMWLTA